MKFEEWFGEELPRLLRLATGLCGSADTAQDLVIKVEQRWSRVSVLDHREAYIRRILVNEYLSYRLQGYLRLEHTTGLLLSRDRPGRVHPYYCQPLVGKDLSPRWALQPEVVGRPVQDSPQVLLGGPGSFTPSGLALIQNSDVDLSGDEQVRWFGVLVLAETPGLGPVCIVGLMEQQLPVTRSRPPADVCRVFRHLPAKLFHGFLVRVLGGAKGYKPPGRREDHSDLFVTGDGHCGRVAGLLEDAGGQVSTSSGLASAKKNTSCRPSSSPPSHSMPACLQRP